MLSTIPKMGTIVNYADVFGLTPPKNKIDIIQSLCKNVVLGEIAGLNYRLKPKTSKYQDFSSKMQAKELSHFCGSNENLLNKYQKLLSPFTSDTKHSYYIFTRQTCLYASEEIINSNMRVVNGFDMRHSWELLLQYLLAVNYSLTRLSESKDYELIKESDILDKVNSETIALNELTIDVDPLYTPYRGYRLLKFLWEYDKIGDVLVKYLFTKYRMDFEQFIYELFRFYIANNRNNVNDITNEFTGEKIDTTFYYKISADIKQFAQTLSETNPNNIIGRLISVKKSPFFQIEEDEFILLDNIVLLDKCYNQFINDFWFDCVKSLKNEIGDGIFSIKQYRSFIGYFLENYVDHLLKPTFTEHSYYVFKSFSELKIPKESKNIIELADVYIRYHKKIFISQVKSSGLYDNAKYSGNVEELYGADRSEFFKSFGINQLVKSIENLEAHIEKLDPSFRYIQSFKVYPAIIINEKALQTPFMAQIFNLRFQELIQSFKNDRFNILPLSIIHVSDLEQLHSHIAKKPNELWRILKYNIREPKFIPPFFNTINRLNIKPDYQKPKELMKHLIKKYSNANLSKFEK